MWEIASSSACTKNLTNTSLLRCTHLCRSPASNQCPCLQGPQGQKGLKIRWLRRWSSPPFKNRWEDGRNRFVSRPIRFPIRRRRRPPYSSTQSLLRGHFSSLLLRAQRFTQLSRREGRGLSRSGLGGRKLSALFALLAVGKSELRSLHFPYARHQRSQPCEGTGPRQLFGKVSGNYLCRQNAFPLHT